MSEPVFSIVFLVLLFSVSGIISLLYCLGTRRTTVFTVSDKGTLTHGYTNNGRGTTYTNFMVYTRDNRAFKNVNNIWFWKWRSTELQAKIQKGKKYSAEIYGWRIGGIGLYPNIVSIKEIKSKKHK